MTRRGAEHRCIAKQTAVDQGGTDGWSLRKSVPGRPKLAGSTAAPATKQPSLTAALRNYELAVFASLSGIEPVLAESDAAYQRRQEELVKKLRAARDAVELES